MMMGLPTLACKSATNDCEGRQADGRGGVGGSQSESRLAAQHRNRKLPFFFVLCSAVVTARGADEESPHGY